MGGERLLPGSSRLRAAALLLLIVFSGHRSRVAWLDKLIVHMKSKPGVWFATEEEIARYLKSQGPTKS